VSGGPAISEANPGHLDLYGPWKRPLTQQNPLFVDTVDNKFPSLNGYDSNRKSVNQGPATSSPSGRSSGISQHPRFELPHEKPGQQKEQSKEHSTNISTRKLEQPTKTQQEIRSEEWLKRREEKKRSRDKFNQ
jgi:hypothetical protein